MPLDKCRNECIGGMTHDFAQAHSRSPRGPLVLIALGSSGRAEFRNRDRTPIRKSRSDPDKVVFWRGSPEERRLSRSGAPREGPLAVSSSVCRRYFCGLCIPTEKCPARFESAPPAVRRYLPESAASYSPRALSPPFWRQVATSPSISLTGRRAWTMSLIASCIA